MRVHPGDLTNSGTLAGRTLIDINAETINNLGGRITAGSVGLNAKGDLNNIGANALSLTAGRDINIASTTRTQTSAQGSRINLYRIAGVYVTNPGGTLVASAGHDLNLIGAIVANAAPGGTTVLGAGNDLNLGTVTTRQSDQLVFDAKNHNSLTTGTEVGSQVQGAGRVSLSAGRDLVATAADLQAGGALALTGGRDVTVGEAHNTVSLDAASEHTSKGFMATRTLSTQDRIDQRNSVGSSLGGATVTVQAGRNLAVTGSNVASDNATTLVAGNNLTLQAGTSTSTEARFSQEKNSGLMSSGGIGFTYGERKKSDDDRVTATTAAASTVGSVGGNVTLVAGNAYRQVGSDVLAPSGDVTILGQSVAITEARETRRSTSEQLFSQSGLTVAVTAPVVQAVQAVAAAAKATGETKSGRMQALGAASTALAAAAAAAAVQEAVAKAASGSVVNVSITVGSSKSKTDTTSQSDSARGSQVSGNNVTIAATGAGQDSNLTLQGSDITARTNATLLADNRIDLLASQGSASQHTTSSSQSSAVGVAIDIGAGGMAFGVTASASAARGHQDGADVVYSNAHVGAGDTATLVSGGNTTLNGAVVAANRVKTDIGGNLAIQSLQDTSVFESKNQSIGASATVGFGGSGSGYFSNAKAKGDFASVAEQAGIKAGDGGFDVNVKGTTDLAGGVIASTQAALDSGKNSFRTASLTTSDIENRVSHAASGVSVSGGYGKKDDAAGSASGVQTFGAGSNGAAVGVASDKGSQSSTTKAGISGIAGDQGVRTGDTGTALTKDWSGEAMSREVNAQLKITSTFGQQASKAVGDYANAQTAKYEGARLAAEQAQKTLDTSVSSPEQRQQAQGQLDGATSVMASEQVNYDNWKEGGAYRALAHTTVGGLAGGVGGALGAGSAALAAPMIDAATAGLPEGVKNLVGAAVAAGIGAVTGGAAGAAAGFNEDANNRQLHQDERDWAKKNAAKYQQFLAEKTGEKITTEEAYQRLLSAGYAIVDDSASKTGKSDETAKQFINRTGDKNLFTASAAERASPFIGGNADGSYTPEQQARFGLKTPAEQASVAITKAVDYIGQPCTDCKAKFAAIDSAVTLLQEAKVLYQDDSGSVKIIDQQIEQLKSGITIGELARGMAGVISDKDKGIAALLLGVPSKLVIGAGVGELIERVTLTQAIKDVRLGLPSGAKNGGNVAIAAIDIPGLPTQMAASSKVDIAGRGVVGDGGQNFTFTTIESTAGKAIERNTDSEYKILDNIADTLGHNSSASGSIKIVTERPACDSCLGVVDQFRAKYPSIDVRVFDNNGKTLLPKNQVIRSR